MVIIRLRLLYTQKNPLHRILPAEKSRGGTKPNIRVRNANRCIGKVYAFVTNRNRQLLAHRLQLAKCRNRRELNYDSRLRPSADNAPSQPIIAFFRETPQW